MTPEQAQEFTEKLEVGKVDGDTMYAAVDEVAKSIVTDVMPHISSASKEESNAAVHAVAEIGAASIGVMWDVLKQYELSTDTGALEAEEAQEAIARLRAASTHIAKSTDRYDEYRAVHDKDAIRGILFKCTMRSSAPSPSLKKSRQLVDAYCEQTQASMELIAISILQAQAAGYSVESTVYFDKKMQLIIDLIDTFNPKSSE